MSVSTRIAGLGVHLPERVRSTAETEQRLRAENPGMRLATGLISRMTGVQQVHVAPDDWQASDLAVAASRQALEESPGEIDLVKPYEIHTENTMGERTVAVIIRSEKSGGFNQGRYDPKTNKYWESLGPRQTPTEMLPKR